MPKRLLNAEPNGRREVGIPRARWLGEANKNVGNIGIRALHSEECRTLLEKNRDSQRVVELIMMMQIGFLWFSVESNGWTLVYTIVKDFMFSRRRQYVSVKRWIAIK
jgi:hypothetical protein